MPSLLFPSADLSQTQKQSDLKGFAVDSQEQISLDARNLWKLSLSSFEPKTILMVTFSNFPVRPLFLCTKSDTPF